MSEECFDVVLQSNGPFGYNPEYWRTDPPPKNDFHLSTEFWIGSLPYNVDSDAVFDACAPAGFNFNPHRTFACRYAFCRRVLSPNEGYFTWDNDGCFRRTLFVSRLIHPTTIAPKHSARLFFEDAKLKSIVPGHVRGYATHVWVVAKEWRDWLSETEVERFRQSIGAYNLNPPERVRRARGYIDQAFHAFYFDHRTASIVSSFESLLKVDRYKATAQFKLRVPALAKLVGCSMAEDEAEDFYDDRSIFVHGGKPNYTDVGEDLMERYQRFETILRRTLLRASTDATFGDLFASDGAVVSTFGSL